MSKQKKTIQEFLEKSVNVKKKELNYCKNGFAQQTKLISYYLNFNFI